MRGHPARGVVVVGGARSGNCGRRGETRTGAWRRAPRPCWHRTLPAPPSASLASPAADEEEKGAAASLVDVCDVVVVGAGPGGLAAALALQAEGFDVVVVERKPSFRRAGAAVFIWAHGINNLRVISPEACERVKRAGAEIRTIDVQRLVGDDRTETLVRAELQFWIDLFRSEPQVGVTWYELQTQLRCLLKPGTVRLGHKLAALHEDAEGVTLRFAAGAAGADEPRPILARRCVVGADGVHSTVRQFVVADGPAKPTQDDVPIWYALARNETGGGGGGGGVGAEDRGPQHDEPAFANTLRFCLNSGSGISLLDVGRGGGGDANSSDDGGDEQQQRDGEEGERLLMWGISDFQTNGGLPADSTAEQKVAYTKSLFHDESSPLVRASLAQTALSAVYETRLFERNSATSWVRGRVALLGDAAHCMYPSLGLGISTAFGDARELAKAMREARVRPSSSAGGDKEEEEAEQRALVERALLTYSRNRIPLTWVCQLGSRIMHRIFAALAK